MMFTSGVYEILNVVNGKRYVGSSVDLDNRQRQHFGFLQNGNHHNPHLQAAWNKYGADAFKFQPLLICVVKHLIMFEQRCLDGFKPEYNMHLIAGSRLGSKASKVTKAKMRAAKLGRRIPLETRIKMSKAALGKPKSPEAIAKNRARIQTIETRAKISKAHLGMRHSPESIAKMKIVQHTWRARKPLELPNPSMET